MTVRPGSSQLAPALEKQFSDLETRMSSYEGRLTDAEKRLTHRLEDGFGQVLSQLQALSVPAIADAMHQPSAKRFEPMQTPHKKRNLALKAGCFSTYVANCFF